MYRNRGQHGHGRYSAQNKQPPPPSQAWGGGGGADPGVKVFTPDSGGAQQGNTQWDWSSTWDAPAPPSQPTQPPAGEGYGAPPAQQQPGVPAGVHSSVTGHQPGLGGVPAAGAGGYPPSDHSPPSQPTSLPPMSAPHGPPPTHGHQGLAPGAAKGHPNAMPPTGHGPQSMPPSADYGPQSMPPSSGYGPRYMPPASAHGPQSMPPSSAHGPQSMPPSSAHGPQSMPPSSGHGPQGMPPSSGHGMPSHQMHRPPGPVPPGRPGMMPPTAGDSRQGRIPSGGAPLPPTLTPSSAVNNTSPPSHAYTAPPGAPQMGGYPHQGPHPPQNLSAAPRPEPPQPAQYPPPAVTATAPTPEQFPAQPTAQNHYPNQYHPGPDFAAASTPLTPAEMLYPPLAQDPYTPSEQEGGYNAGERGSYEAGGYANGDGGGGGVDWGWDQAGGGWGGDSAPPGEYTDHGGVYPEQPPGSATHPSLPASTAAAPQAGSHAVPASHTAARPAGEDYGAAASDGWGWGDDSPPGEDPARGRAGGEADDVGTVGMFFGGGGEEDPRVDAMTAGMEHLQMNGPGELHYQPQDYGSIPADPAPSQGAPAPPLGHRMTPTGGREGDEPGPPRTSQTLEGPLGVPGRDAHEPVQPTPPGMTRPESLPRPGSLEGRHGRGSVVSDMSDGPDRPHSAVSSGSHRSASGSQTQPPPPPPPPSEQRNSPLGTVGGAVSPPGPPAGPPLRGLAPPQERGHGRGEREEPENREVPPPETEAQPTADSASLPAAGGLEWTHPQGDGSHAPPPPASQPPPPAASHPEPRIVPGTGPGPASGAPARSAFAAVKPTSAPPPAASAPGAPRPPPDGPGADASGRRSPPDGPRPPRSETIGSEDGAAAANAGGGGGGGGGNQPAAVAQRNTRRGDGEDDSPREREDRDDSRERERGADERRERDRDDRRDRDRDRYDRRGYDDRDRRDRDRERDRDRDRDRRDRDVDRDDRYYERGGRRRYDSIDSRRGDDYRDYERDRHGRRRDGRDRDEYDDRRRRERRRDPRDDYYDPDRSRPSSRAGSERDFDGRPPSRSHSYYSHRDASYHAGYGYRERERAGSRQPDPALYGHGYPGAGGAGVQRPLYDDRTLYSYFVHLERLRASNPQLFTQQMAAYRNNNPAFYRDLCQRHYRSLLQPAAGAGAAAAGGGGGGYPGYPGSEERTSVHSGRSSVNEEENKSHFAEQFHQHRPTSALGYEPSAILANDSYAVSEASYRIRRFEEEAVTTSAVDTKPDRMTPAKFAYPHTVVRFSATGHLVRVLPHSPADGSAALVEIHDTSALLANTLEAQELKRFPGPLVKNDTHKSSVLQFCQQKMREAEQHPGLVDKDSCVLVWQLLLLLIRQNGMVVGSDMAELLLRDRGGSISPDSARCEDADAPSESSEGPDRALVNRAPERPAPHRDVRRFTELLMYGHRKEALELAMKRGIWGHALFLASKMDQRTYGQVMARFANGLLYNDPLQTLYQLMSGRQPSCTTSCADERWGDWRPHLAMILSNTSHRPELNRRAIITLGDTLASRGLLHAAHFCYLMAQCEFGPFCRKSSKLVLIGSAHQLPWGQFATNEAIQRTEIFEYAQSLGTTDYVLTHLQAIKFLYATRLAEIGMVSECLHYCEVIAQLIAKYPASFNYALVSRVYNLGSQLKFLDAHYQSGEGELADMGDPEWLVALQNVIGEMQAGRLAAYPAPEGLTPSEGEGGEAAVTPTDPQLQQQAYDPGMQQAQYGQEQQVVPTEQPQTQTQPPYSQPEYGSQPLQQQQQQPEQAAAYDPNQAQYASGAYDAGVQQPFIPQAAADQPDGQTGDYWGGWGYASTPGPAGAGDRRLSVSSPSGDRRQSVISVSDELALPGERRLSAVSGAGGRRLSACFGSGGRRMSSGADGRRLSVVFRPSRRMSHPSTPPGALGNGPESPAQTPPERTSAPEEGAEANAGAEAEPSLPPSTNDGGNYNYWDGAQRKMTPILSSPLHHSTPTGATSPRRVTFATPLHVTRDPDRPTRPGAAVMNRSGVGSISDPEHSPFGTDRNLANLAKRSSPSVRTANQTPAARITVNQRTAGSLRARASANAVSAPAVRPPISRMSTLQTSNQRRRRDTPAKHQPQSSTIENYTHGNRHSAEDQYSPRSQAYTKATPMRRPRNLNLSPRELDGVRTFPVDAPCCSPPDLCEDHARMNRANRATASRSLSSEDNSESEASSLPSEGESEPPKPQATPTPSPDGQSAAAGARGEKPAAGGGWFGGIFSKFGKAKNQMILPDDKEKSIVYDPDKKRWVDKDADPNDQAAQAAVAPPSDSQLTGAGGGLPPPPSAGGPGNKFKIPKGRGMRSNYVDVFGGGTAGPSPGAAPAGMPPPMMSPLVPTPGPVSGSDSSLEQQQPVGGEVPAATSAAPGVPPMFNPGQVTGAPPAATPAAGRGRLGRYGRR